MKTNALSGFLLLMAVTVVLCFFFGCATSRQLPENFVQSERFRWFSYLVQREHGDYFRGAEYDSSRASFSRALLTVDQKRENVIAPITRVLANMRSVDSTSINPTFFARYRTILDGMFQTANFVDSLERVR